LEDNGGIWEEINLHTFTLGHKEKEGGNGIQGIQMPNCAIYGCVYEIWNLCCAAISISFIHTIFNFHTFGKVEKYEELPFCKL
jgi:hypothetical protein